jgi:hypothetical protein
LVGGLATAARMRARQHDDIVDRSCRRLIELAPDSSNVHYNYGLFLKTRGRFRDKVRLAERPLAERSADSDDPGLEETIWIERLSPCHGIIRSVLYQHLGVDFGDVILIDGAPITYHTYGETKVPVFPHLATLVRNQYQFFDFAGTQ